MRAERLHSVAGLIAIAAYVANLVAAAGGAVLCLETHGDSSIELACDHDHCASAIGTGHDHEPGDCWCSACPCEDRPLAKELVPRLKDDDVQACMACMACSPTPFGVVSPAARRVALRWWSPPAGDGSSRRLRTVVVIV